MLNVSLSRQVDAPQVNLKHNFEHKNKYLNQIFAQELIKCSPPLLLNFYDLSL